MIVIGNNRTQCNNPFSRKEQEHWSIGIPQRTPNDFKIPNAEDKSMKNKLSKIAELFEMDVLSEEDALKACKTVIQQHAKAKEKVGRLENDAKV
jgi:hypothetical protein